MKLIRDNLDRFYDYHLHLETRTIYLGDSTGADGVDEIMAEYILKSLHLLTAADQEKPIRIILNSFGGCWYNGMAIYDAIKACPNHVTIEVFGSAMSMGSVILQAADERIIHPNAHLMIHDGWESSHPNTPRSFEAQAKQSKLIRENMYQIYAERSQKPVQFWEKKCSADHYLTAEEAVKFGLADKIAGETTHE